MVKQEGSTVQKSVNTKATAMKPVKQFNPQHHEGNPNLHETFWKAAKLCSACKVEVSAEHAQELMDAVEQIHNLFWNVKGREVPWIRAS